MNIPLVDNRTDLDCCQRFYRRAIYNTLLELQPTYCLEIGSYLFQSSSVWSQYHEKYHTEGKLVTCDIANWSKALPPKNVIQVMVYPHIVNIHDNHGGIEIYYKDYQEHVHTSVEDNIHLIKETMIAFNIDGFDLTFVDGDHAKESFLRDLLIAQHLTKPNGYILIDDVNDRNHDQYTVYRELQEKGNKFYEYDDWSPNPGMALIRAEDLIL